MGACTGGAEEHCGVANEISLILTAQNSKFHIGTWNLARIEVVEEGKIYNFDIGQNLIWVLDLGEKHT